MADQPLLLAATLMRGGTSKGLFFRLEDLPEPCRIAGPARDRLLLRLMGSPDPYGNQIDGLGGATSSTSKCVLLSRSDRPGHDVDYLYGQVAIDRALVDWSGNCGNLSAAAGAFALHAGLVSPERIPRNGHCAVRIWQANIGQTLVVHVPIRESKVQQHGDFTLAGVAFPGAEIAVEFHPPEEAGDVLPTGNPVDELEVAGEGRLQATLVDAGIAAVLVRAEDLGYLGTELQGDLNGDSEALARLERIRVAGALRMGLIQHAEEALDRQHTPKLVMVAPPRDSQLASGQTLAAGDIDLLVRALSMGRLHHAMMGTAAIALAAAVAIPGTLAREAAREYRAGPVRLGHPSGCLSLGCEVHRVGQRWRPGPAIMQRSARILMEGQVWLPPDCL